MQCVKPAGGWACTDTKLLVTFSGGPVDQAMQAKTVAIRTNPRPLRFINRPADPRLSEDLYRLVHQGLFRG